MPIACPSCGARHVRLSRIRGASERFWSLLGIYPMRCRDCDTRFSEGIWKVAVWRFARCPRCYRMDLSTWSERHYNPPFGTRLLVSLGARRYRCEYCRCNFVSFRAWKEKFRWKEPRTAADGPDK